VAIPFAHIFNKFHSILAQGPIEQLNMIIDLLGTFPKNIYHSFDFFFLILGTPKPDEMRGCCDGALKHVSYLTDNWG
jgi:hypothetical protein